MIPLGVERVSGAWFLVTPFLRTPGGSYPALIRWSLPPSSAPETETILYFHPVFKGQVRRTGPSFHLLLSEYERRLHLPHACDCTCATEPSLGCFTRQTATLACSVEYVVWSSQGNVVARAPAAMVEVLAVQCQSSTAGNDV